MLAADQGLPTEVRITFDPSCADTAQPPGQAKQTKPYALAGKTITLHKQPDGSITADPNVDPSLLPDLKAYMEPEPITATVQGSSMTFSTGGTNYDLKKVPNPLANPPAPSAPPQNPLERP